MPTPNHFAFRLRRDPDNYLKLVNSEVVTMPAPADKRLRTTFDIQGPDNWSEEGIRWNRHSTFFGMTTSYSESLTFVGDGLKILKKIFYAGDIEAPLQLEVWAIADYNTSWEYSPYFVGDIDLTTVSPDAVTGNWSVNIKESGIASIIKSRAAIPYELLMRQPTSRYINMDGIKLRGTYNWIVTENLPGTVLFEQGYKWALTTAHTIDDGDFPVANTSTMLYNQMGSALATSVDDQQAADKDNFLLEAYQTMEIAVSMKGPFSFWINHGSPTMLTSMHIDIWVAPATGGNYSQKINLYSSTPILSSLANKAVLNIDVTSAPFTINASDRVYILYSWIKTVDPHEVIVFYDNSQIDFSISSVFRIAPTYAPGIQYYEAFNDLIYQMTDGRSYCLSNYLTQVGLRHVDTYPERWTITCGDAIRGLPNPRLLASLNDFMKDAFCSAGLGGGLVNDVFVVEPLSYFFDRNNEIAVFDKVTEFAIVPDLSMRGNVIKVGMEDQSNDIVNGKNEINGTHTYLLPFVRKTGEVDLVSPFKKDFTSIEQVRSNLTNKKTTDNKADNEAFVISLSNNFTVNNGEYPDHVPVFAKVYDLYRPNTNVNTSGLLFPETAYQLDRSPKRELYRNAPYIAMLNYKRDGQKIKFQSFEKNQDLISNLGDGEVIEKADVQLPIADITNNIPVDPVFLPLLIQFTAQVPRSFNITMAANPYGYISVMWNGKKYKGFINKAGQLSAENRSFQFELQASVDNDFSGL